ncbi:Probable purple acid phosphatase 20 [Ancistrocladus abbreviatus]
MTNRGLFIVAMVAGIIGTALSYIRPPPRETLFISAADYQSPTTPEQVLWDSYGRLVEPLASQRPWTTTTGNHEVEKKVPLAHFIAYNAKWHMPFEESNSNSNLYYSFNVVGVHVIMLCSYTHFGLDSDQYAWLQNDLSSIDKTKTPWVFVLLHVSWYNSNYAHQGEKHQ